VALNYVILGSAPRITGFNVQGGNVVIDGTNGQVGATAFLLTSTNITVPLSQWQTVATNVIGGTGFSFTGTNAISTGSPQQYFLLSSTNYNP